MNTEEKIIALLEQLNTRMENLESGQAALEGRMVSLDSGQAALEGRMVSLESGQAALEGRMVSLESGQAALEGRMERISGDLNFTNLELRNLENKQAAFEGRMGRFETTLTELLGTQSKMQDDLTAVKLCLDLDVEKRFDAVNEGIDAILEKLTPKSRVDELEADVIVLKTAMKSMVQRIAELEKAQ